MDLSLSLLRAVYLYSLQLAVPLYILPQSRNLELILIKYHTHASSNQSLSAAQIFFLQIFLTLFPILLTTVLVNSPLSELLKKPLTNLPTTSYHVLPSNLSSTRYTMIYLKSTSSNSTQFKVLQWLVHYLQKLSLREYSKSYMIQIIWVTKFLTLSIRTKPVTSGQFWSDVYFRKISLAYSHTHSFMCYSRAELQQRPFGLQVLKYLLCLP